MVHYHLIALAASFAGTTAPAHPTIGCQDQESLDVRELKLDVRELRLNSQESELRLSRIEELLQQLRSGLLLPSESEAPVDLPSPVDLPEPDRVDLGDTSLTAVTEETTIAEDRRRVSFYLGKRSLDDLFIPVEDQSTFGVGFSKETPGSSVGWEFGFLTSEDDETLLGLDFEASTLEFYGGIHKTFGDPASKVHPFVGGGLSLMMVELDIDLFGFGSDDDDVIGVYIHGGFAFDITETFALGLDYRVFKGPDVELFGIDGSADYDQLALMASFSF